MMCSIEISGIYNVGSELVIGNGGRRTNIARLLSADINNVTQCARVKKRLQLSMEFA